MSNAAFFERCIDKLDAAIREYQQALEGPEMCDYASDAEARRTLHDAVLGVRQACSRVLNNIPWNVGPEGGD